MDFAKEFNKLGKNSNIDNIVSQFKEVDSSVIDMAKSVKDGSMSMDEFTEKSTKATTTTSRFSSVAKSVGTAIKSIGATAANMIGGFLIAEGISLAIQGIYNLVNADKIAIENGQKAQQEIKEVFDTYNGKVDTVKSLGKKFAQDADSIKTTGDAIESIYVIEQMREQFSLTCLIFHYRIDSLFFTSNIFLTLSIASSFRLPAFVNSSFFFIIFNS